MTPPPAHDAAAIAENPSAFPIPEVRDQWGSGIAEGQPGMTLRDWFAGQSVSGFAGSLSRAPESEEEWEQAAVEISALARLSYSLADAMLAARASLAQSKGEE